MELSDINPVVSIESREDGSTLLQQYCNTYSNELEKWQTGCVRVIHIALASALTAMFLFAGLVRFSFSMAPFIAFLGNHMAIFAIVVIVTLRVRKMEKNGRELLTSAADHFGFECVNASMEKILSAWKYPFRQPSLYFLFIINIVDIALFAIFIVWPVCERIVDSSTGNAAFGLFIGIYSVLMIPFIVFSYVLTPGMTMFFDILENCLDLFLSHLSNDFDVRKMLFEHGGLEYLVEKANKLGNVSAFSVIGGVIAAIFGLSSFLGGNSYLNPYIGFIVAVNIAYVFYYLKQPWRIVQKLGRRAGLVAQARLKGTESSSEIKGKTTLNNNVLPSSGETLNQKSEFVLLGRPQLDSLILYINTSDIGLQWLGAAISPGTVVRLVSLCGSLFLFVLQQQLSR